MKCYTDQLRPLSERDYEALKADIGEHGCAVPVLFDDKGDLIDGAHRERVCAELGIPCPHTILHGATERHKKHLAISLNVHRRQLTRTERRDLLAKLIKAEPQKSNRQHAAAVGANPSTADVVRKELEALGDVPETGTSRTDTLGRKQPVKPKQPNKVAPLPEPEPAEEPTASSEFEPEPEAVPTTTCPRCGHIFPKED